MLRTTIDVNEAVVHIDFSENNMQLKYSRPTLEPVISRLPSTLRVLYKVDGLQSFTTVSDSLRHDPPAIWAHLEPILHDLRSTNPEITDLHFYSDGPTTQHRNKINFFLLSTMVHEMASIIASWNSLSQDMERVLQMRLWYV